MDQSLLTGDAGATTASSARDVDAEASLFGKSLTAIQQRVMEEAAANQQLRRHLNEGAQLLSVYHAQLGIDSLRLEERRNAIAEELDQLTTEELHLQQRLSFLFEDCQRLRKDNKHVQSGFAAKDALIADTKHLLHIEEEKFREATEAMHETQEEVFQQSRKLVEFKNELRHVKRNKLAVRREEWERADDVDRLEEVINVLREEMKYLKQRMDAVKVTRAKQQAVSPAFSPLSAPPVSVEVTPGARSLPPLRQSLASRSSSFLKSGLQTADVTPQQASLSVARLKVSSLSNSRNTQTPIANRGNSVDHTARSGVDSTVSTEAKPRIVGPGGCKRQDCIAVAVRIAELKKLLASQ